MQQNWQARYEALCARRTEAARAPMPRVRTVEDRSGAFDLQAIGDDWTRSAFDGPFYQTRESDSVSTGVVFVRSREGNTGTRNPASLGGGIVDEQLVYEGLTRVAADAVIAGAGTLYRDSLFTVWRPELVELRGRVGLPRHPAQVVMSIDGSVDPDKVLLFNLPYLRVFLLTSVTGRERLARTLDARPWVTVVIAGSLREQFAALREAGIHRACSVGGRRSATQLVDAGLVSDVYLTTTEVSAGEPDTPWYVGTEHLALKRVVLKEWLGQHGTVRFEHALLR
jgi:riboflavin biosynthesis pyrimidine reductase